MFEGKIVTLKTEMSGPKPEINDDQATWDGLFRNAAVHQGAAWEWYRQQFFDVQRQQDTLTIWNGRHFCGRPRCWKSDTLRSGDTLRSCTRKPSRSNDALRPGRSVESEEEQFAALAAGARISWNKSFRPWFPDPRPVLGAVHATSRVRPAPAVRNPAEHPPSDT